MIYIVLASSIFKLIMFLYHSISYSLYLAHSIVLITYLFSLYYFIIMVQARLIQLSISIKSGQHVRVGQASCSKDMFLISLFRLSLYFYFELARIYPSNSNILVEASHTLSNIQFICPFVFVGYHILLRLPMFDSSLFCFLFQYAYVFHVVSLVSLRILSTILQ